MTTTLEMTATTNEPARSKRDKQRSRQLARLHVRADEAAELNGVSLATWWRWDAAGSIPQATKIGGVKLWPMRSLKLWSRWGCPNRREFIERLTEHDAARESAKRPTSRLRLRGTQ